jgi:hypothetical protein
VVVAAALPHVDQVAQAGLAQVGFEGLPQAAAEFRTRAS